MNYFLGVCIGGVVVEMDIWSRIFAEKFCIIFKVCGQGESGSKVKGTSFKSFHVSMLKTSVVLSNFSVKKLRKIRKVFPSLRIH